ncbi:Pyruvate-flavodoxin_oxidoreductase 2 [Hexamita inflata]|uniref:Pyruvate-flavodoxin oxidoreductase 2 n=1 Tax=Hexamita inflata TaxID=28002 RepID=A0AA86RJZ2_9EUKA|nr:Pyruvate-flavodoxin oxidoreductase 2 [Hexamita inflata]
MSKYLCLDGNTAAAMIAYKLIDVAAIYPITPSSTMSEMVEQYSAQKQLNAFGNVVTVHQTQSELGAAACVHGASKSGALAATFTSSQGLLLMIPNLYFLAGSKVPAVIHLACRSVGMSSTSLSCDHSDIYAVSNTNMSAICSRNVQETHDMSLAAHLSAVEASASFIHFFEGFRVSHQFESFQPIDNETVKGLVNNEKIAKWRETIVDPSHPDGRGIGLGPEMYYPAFEAQKYHYNQVSGLVQAVLEKIHKATGRKYSIMEYSGHPEAETVIIVMGCSALTVEAVVAKLDKKVGVINIRLWKPFDMEYFTNLLPKSCKNVLVLDRARDFTSNGELLYKEVIASLVKQRRISNMNVKNITYGICGADILPGEVLAVIEAAETDVQTYRLGVNDPETLPKLPCNLQLLHPQTKELTIYAIGSDGTIGAIRNAMKILQDESPECQSQANFEFDGKKSGGLTISYLRFGPEKIKTQFNPEQADYIACHTQSYIGKYDFLAGARNGATFVLNCDFQDIEKHIPANLKRQIAEKDIKFYVVNANGLANSVGLGNKISLILSMFLMALGMNGLVDIDTAAKQMKVLAKITYAKQPQAVIDANMKAIDLTLQQLDNCRYNYNKQNWMNANSAEDLKIVKYGPDTSKDELLKEGGVYDKVMKRQFNEISTQDAMPFSSGIFPAGYSKFEKPGTADHVAHWDQTNCIQCNLCASACPHGSIRPFVSQDSQLEGLPCKDGTFRIQVSPLDCRGCQVCAGACPKKCIDMRATETEVIEQQPKWDWAVENVKPIKVDTQKCSLKDLQLSEQYLFNPGSCPGCPETVIARMLSNLFGDHLVVSSAVGCCLVWGHYNQTRPYQVDSKGRGPAVATSAFEDNSLFGLGMNLANTTHRNNLKVYVQQNLDKVEGEIKTLLQQWVEKFDDAQVTIQTQEELIVKLQNLQNPIGQYLREHQMFFSKQIHWIIGGDGWSYDIDFGGVDHVMASGQNVNILIFNNNCFANTGGQFSKATPIGAIAKDAYLGVNYGYKRISEMFMTYRRAYVAQVALGYNKMQGLKALREAAEFNGPSMVIAYCPCISHTINGGLKNSEPQQKLAVESGLWPLFRYDPRRTEKKLQMDSKVTKKVEEFTCNEQRFAALEKKDNARYLQFKVDLQNDVDEAFKLLEKMAE